MNKKINCGQSLLELIFALGAIALVTTGVASLAIKSISNSTFSRNNSDGTRLSQEAEEWIRGERNLGWRAFTHSVKSVSGGILCMDTLSWENHGACTSGENVVNYTNFTRQAVFTCYNKDELLGNCASNQVDNIKAYITTSWTDQTGLHQSKLVIFLGDTQ